MTSDFNSVLYIIPYSYGYLIGAGAYAFETDDCFLPLDGIYHRIRVGRAETLLEPAK